MTKINRTSRRDAWIGPSKKMRAAVQKNDRCLGRLSNAETTA